MYKKLMSLVLILALTGVASAASNINWMGGTGYWDVSTNWVGGVVPVNGDNARFDVTYQPAHIQVRNYDTTPTARVQWRTNAGDMTVLNGGYFITNATMQMDPSVGRTGTITIQTNATMWGGARNDTNLGDFYLGRATAAGDSIVNVYGTLRVESQNVAVNGVSTLDIGGWSTGGTPGNGTGTLNVYSGGVVYADLYNINPIEGTFRIKFGWTGKMYVAGNVVAQAQADILAGRIVGLQGNTPIAYYDSSLGKTVIPEPATIALLGLGGLALLRRRS